LALRWFSLGRFPKDAAEDRVPEVAVEEVDKKIEAMMPITITPRRDATAEHDPKPQDMKGVVAAIECFDHGIQRIDHPPP
jgi:hypothetical protein